MAGTPRARPGEIKCQWGKLADHSPDLISCWGEGTDKADARLLMGALTSPKYSLLDESWLPSLIEELDSRGYDTKTLKISVQKKEGC